jgi:ribosomal protein S18 acetylase RimI-like enzyme
MRACEAEIKETRIRLCVRASNTPAISMYEHLGYLPIETWRGYYDDKENALVMEKVR